MNRILTTKIWSEARKLARSADSRKLAIAYVTVDHVGLRLGDVLVTDASPRAVSSGQTDAKLLAKLNEDGVAAVLSDEPTIRSGVASFIAQLCTKKSRLDSMAIDKLCKIKVVRNGWQKGLPKKGIRIRRLGNTTWIVGVYDLKRDPTEDEQKRIDRATSDINNKLGTTSDEYDWIRWGKKTRFAKECRVGDTLIQISNHGKTRA